MLYYNLLFKIKNKKKKDLLIYLLAVDVRCHGRVSLAAAAAPLTCSVVSAEELPAVSTSSGIGFQWLQGMAQEGCAQPRVLAQWWWRTGLVACGMWDPPGPGGLNQCPLHCKADSTTGPPG